MRPSSLIIGMVAPGVTSAPIPAPLKPPAHVRSCAIAPGIFGLPVPNDPIFAECHGGAEGGAIGIDGTAGRLGKGVVNA